MIDQKFKRTAHAVINKTIFYILIGQFTTLPRNLYSTVFLKDSNSIIITDFYNIFEQFASIYCKLVGSRTQHSFGLVTRHFWFAKRLCLAVENGHSSFKRRNIASTPSYFWWVEVYSQPAGCPVSGLRDRSFCSHKSRSYIIIIVYGCKRRKKK